MKKTILTLGVILLLAVALFVLTGCGDNGEKGLIGSWAYKPGSSDIVYKFNKDNTGSYKYYTNERTFKYEDNGTSVKITYDGDTTGSTYEYKIEGKKLIIKDSFGKDVTYEKM